ncbi:MAG TPA: hypothetical protein VK655_03990, partial [Solirubrobacteraceae bacterium]|nr:hypothetical protein [Solirubrobacteraceae bacterium]
ITVGGFGGSDPTPTAAQLEQLLRSGQLRYVVLDAARVLQIHGVQRGAEPGPWVERHCARVPSASITLRHTRIASALALFDCAEA